MYRQTGHVSLDEFLGSLRNYLSRFLRSSGRHVSNSRFDTSDVIQESLIQIWSECQKECSAERENSTSQPSPDGDSLHSISFAKFIISIYVFS